MHLLVDLIGYELSGVGEVDQGNVFVLFFIIIESLFLLGSRGRASFLACLADSRRSLLISLLAIAFVLLMLLNRVEEVGQHLEEVILLG